LEYRRADGMSDIMIVLNVVKCENESSVDIAQDRDQ
jgi:hypothetical protein